MHLSVSCSAASAKKKMYLHIPGEGSPLITTHALTTNGRVASELKSSLASEGDEIRRRLRFLNGVNKYSLILQKRPGVCRRRFPVLESRPRFTPGSYDAFNQNSNQICDLSV